MTYIIFSVSCTLFDFLSLDFFLMLEFLYSIRHMALNHENINLSVLHCEFSVRISGDQESYVYYEF